MGWNQVFTFKVWHIALEHLHINVWDHNYMSHPDFLGSCDIDLRMALGDAHHCKKKFRLQMPEEPEMNAGSVELELDYQPLEDHAHELLTHRVKRRLTESGFDAANSSACSADRAQLIASIEAKEPVRGLLTIELQAASDLDDCDTTKICPCVVVRLVEEVNNVCEPLITGHLGKVSGQKFSEKYRTKSPVWNESKYFEVQDAMRAVAHVDVRDASQFGREGTSGSLGEFQVPLRAFLELVKRWRLSS